MSLHHDGNDNAYTRRQFLHNGIVLASAAAAVPAFLQRSAQGMTNLAAANAGLSSIPGVPDDRILVVVQMSGGNDGLNTVAPYAVDAYHRARPTIGLRGDQVLRLNDTIGLHPALDGLKDMYDDGMMSIVQGVGYPNPNRSHFTSMDIWQTADTSGTGTGWLGRYYDSQCCGFGAGESGRAPAGQNQQQGNTAQQPPMSIGRTAELALQGRKVAPVAFETPELFRWTGQDVHETLLDPYQRIHDRASEEGIEAGSSAEFLMRTAMDAQVSSDMIRRAVARRSPVTYPRSQLGRELSMVAAMIQAGMKSRVYYVSHGGFDTHAQQGGPNGSHANRLRELGQSVRTFYEDLKSQGNDGRVLTMSFSEFGRRVAQNASGGTDHGTAAPMFLMGPMVNPGVIGNHPSLDAQHLDNGDLRFHTDFRSVYAGVLDNWLGGDSAEVLGGRYRPTPVIKNS